MINDIEEKKQSEHAIREKIVNVCLELDISPIKFNQGAWFLGYHSFDIVLWNLDKG